MISASGVRLNWESETENDSFWRVLKLPMLGIEVCYATRGRELILTNDEDFLRNVPSRQNSIEFADLAAPMTGLTVVNLDRRQNAYNLIFAELAKNKAADDFFTGSVASLIDSAADVKKIEIKANSSHNVLEQVVTAYFR